MNFMRLLIFFIFIFLQICKYNDSLETLSASETNITNLSRIHYGMTEEEVECVMHLPYKKKSFEIENDSYEVWFYITNATTSDQKKLVRTNLTPLIFKNDLYISKGYNYYYWLIKQEETENLKSSPLPSQKPSSEDTQLE